MKKVQNKYGCLTENVRVELQGQGQRQYFEHGLSSLNITSQSANQDSHSHSRFSQDLHPLRESQDYSILAFKVFDWREFHHPVAKVRAIFRPWKHSIQRLPKMQSSGHKSGKLSNM